MYFNVPKDARLNCFCPARIPKVKDVFKRMGFRKLSTQDGQTADFSRNPLSQFDTDSQKFSDFVQDHYEEYAEKQNAIESKKEDTEKESQVEDEN